MLLAIDVGNTNVVFGIFEGKEIVSHWRIGTDKTKTSDEYGVLFKNLFEVKGISQKLIKGAAPAVLSSSIIAYQNKNTRASVYASSEKAEYIYNFEIEQGQFYTASDVQNSANVAVVGHTVINKIFGKIDPIGKIIKVDGKNFTVIRKRETYEDMIVSEK